jgi:hypothetical protein
MTTAVIHAESHSAIRKLFSPFAFSYFVAAAKSQCTN